MEMTQEQIAAMMARLAQLEKQVANKNAKGTSLKIGEKGGVSYYGVGRYPVSLYYEQWITLLNDADKIRAFVEEQHAAGLLKVKPAKEEQTNA